MTLSEIRKFGESSIEKYLDSTWVFKLVSTKCFLGRCKERDNGGIIEVAMNHAMNSSWEDVKDTILHEISHAIVGNCHGHDKVWQECAKRIGASPEKYAKHDVIPYKYYLVHVQSKTLANFARDASPTWVRKPQNYVINNKPETKGELCVVTHAEFLKLGIPLE